MILLVCICYLAFDFFKVRWGFCSRVFNPRLTPPSSSPSSGHKRAFVLWPCKAPLLGPRCYFYTLDIGWFMAYRGALCILGGLFCCHVFLVFSPAESRSLSLGLCSSLVSAYVITLCICNVREPMFLLLLLASLISLLFKTSFFVILILLEVLLILIALSLLKSGISA